MTRPKTFSFASMMVLAQRRHAARMAAEALRSREPTQRCDTAARQAAQKTNGTKRLLAFMYAA